ncbi:MAG: nucleotidyl transferase AbiEii/AbiGii toxin family protein [Parcubacteria group bacterium]|jgi:predicted nucleotidyltransferase component of viral defense system
MNNLELKEYIKKLGISADQILREEAEMEFLKDFSESKLSSNVVFYGGTALRLAYNSPRFSEDLDFLTIKNIRFSEFKKLMEKIEKNHSGWKLTDTKEKRQTIFALFNIYDEKLKHSFSVKIEIHKPERKTKFKTDLMLIKSPISINEPLVLVPALQELKTFKEMALMQRRKARDIFDLWYISQVLRENFVLPKKVPPYSAREFKNELQVFLPKKYYPIVSQLYEKITGKN